MKTALASVAVALVPGAVLAADLEITHVTANEGSIFPVASSLIEGPSEVILIDAQFEKDDAQTLVEMIQATGKTLTTVYVSQKDPDYYFGLDIVRAAFPDVRIVASPETVKGIEGSIQQKFEVWGPILGDNAPSELIVPEVLEGDSLSVDGEAVNVIGLDGHDPVHTFLWVPSEQTVLGGVVLFENMHVWMADSQTPESRDAWRQTLDEIEALAPARVLPGHLVGTSSEDLSIVAFMRDYLTTFEAAAEQADGSEALIAEMSQAYPDFAVTAVLSISAEVAEGERTWP